MDKKSDAYYMARFLSERKTIEEMLGHLFAYQDKGAFFNEYDLYEVCKDKIRSKKDKFRPIKVALKHMVEKHIVVKSFNRYGEPIYRSKFDERLELLEKGEVKMPKRVEGEQEKKVRMSYNIIYGASIPNRWSDTGDFAKLTEKQQWHYLQFSSVVLDLIRKLGNLDTFIPWYQQGFEKYKRNENKQTFNEKNKHNQD